LPLTEQQIKLSIEVDLPDFRQGSEAPKGPPAREAPEVLAEDMAKALPDLDDLDLNDLSNVNSLIPSIDKQKKEEKQMRAMQMQY
jgi:hypothetical protein